MFGWLFLVGLFVCGVFVDDGYFMVLDLWVINYGCSLYLRLLSYICFVMLEVCVVIVCMFHGGLVVIMVYCLSADCGVL